MIVTTKESAPGGARQCKVVLPPDPGLFDHMVKHGVFIDVGETEGDRVSRAFLIQV